ncbi:hypothetical protein VTK73DRAFT_6058 [Phialemonium thermophilum]|uniref:CWH43-like N-terminal domain-containing protein n=1 Tax=Phialemonium thermophilum TaxID=223376 RepID=A0ABR3XX14_9PEZI
MMLISYWVFPIVGSLVWLGMLLGLLIHWCVDTHYKHYSSMSAGQSIAYISDVGASELKPLFIAGCTVTTICLDLSFLSDRWLRHRGRLLPNTSTFEKVLSILTIIFAFVGTCGLILLSIFDTVHYPRLHDVFLLLFIAGYVLSAIFICWQYQRLGSRYRDHPVLHISFIIKLIFIVVEILLAIAFIACNWTNHTNAAAVLEWLVAFIFSFYILSFFVDLLPAVRTRKTSPGAGVLAHGRRTRAGRFCDSYTGGGGSSVSEYDRSASRYVSGHDMEEAGSDRHLTTQNYAHGGGDYYPHSNDRTAAMSNNF